MAEWLNAVVSKTAKGATPSRVRIPLSPFFDKVISGNLRASKSTLFDDHQSDYSLGLEQLAKIINKSLS